MSHGVFSARVLAQTMSSAGCVHSKGSSFAQIPSCRMCSASSRTLALSGSDCRVEKVWKLKQARDNH